MWVTSTSRAMPYQAPAMSIDKVMSVSPYHHMQSSGNRQPCWNHSDFTIKAKPAKPEVVTRGLDLTSIISKFAAPKATEVDDEEE